jgi:isopentenyl-diphosphate delta-isomerase
MPDGPSTTGLEDIRLLNCSLPELDLEEIDLSQELWGKKLQFPLIINALTGGNDQAKSINRDLAIVCRKYGLAMAVGSQTIALENPNRVESFSIVRDYNPEGVVIANLGAGTGTNAAREAVNMIAADAIQLHLNVPQELAMPEGERCFRGIVDKVAKIVNDSEVPVIAKEVGFGLSRESVQQLYQVGVRVFDIGGQGGTNFIAIEDKRGGLFQGELDSWGIPTAVSLAEIVACVLPITIMASGGIRSAVEVAKCLAMGANMVGIAGHFLKILLSDGIDALDRFICDFLYRLKAVYVMCGAKDSAELRAKPLIIMGDTAQWLKARNVDLRLWSKA